MSCFVDDDLSDGLGLHVMYDFVTQVFLRAAASAFAMATEQLILRNCRSQVLVYQLYG